MNDRRPSFRRSGLLALALLTAALAPRASA
jgi:hypothetical protein